MITAKKTILGLTGLLIGAALVLGSGRSDVSSSSGPIVSVDAVPDASNTATSVGSIESCVALSSGATFQVDVVIQSVGSLSGLEASLLYDPAILRVTQVSYDFLLATSGSTLLDLGETPPDTDGNFGMGAVTFPLSSVSGSGVLVRIGLEAVGDGLSPLDLAEVKLADGLGDPVQPADSSGVYQGPVNDALAAPGAECSDSDLDGYPDTDELVIGTNPQDSCGDYDLSHPNPDTDTKPSLSWPSDFNMSTSPLDSYHRINVLDVTSFIAPVRYLGTDVGTNPEDGRWDVVPGSGMFATGINVQDLTALLAGSTGHPPMFGGVRAYGGPACSES